MTRDDIDELMRNNGIVVVGEAVYALCQLVAAAERDACAKVCDELQDVPATEPRHCAEDIRAREKK
jgi:hypothetical protein